MLQKPWGASHLVLIGYILVAIIGCVDFATKDYSMLIFYLIPISIIAYFFDLKKTVCISLAAALARFISDYSYSSAVRCSNVLQDDLFLVSAGVVVIKIRTLLCEK